MSAAVLEAPPDEELWLPPAYRQVRPQTGLTSTHLLAGGGGDTLGLWEAGFLPLYGGNHEAVCIESLIANWAGLGTEHELADIAHLAMSDLPSSDVLWASVICTEVSPAGRRSRYGGPMGVDRYGRPLGNRKFRRTRATALDVMRAAEYHRYRAIVVENVIDFVTRWELFGWWVMGMCLLGYRFQLVSVSAAHVGDEHNPAANQLRDRIYAVFTRLDVPIPDLSPRPASWCPTCRRTVRGEQRWRRAASRRPYPVGRHGHSYDYVCPSLCGSIVRPHVRPAAEAFDLDDLGEPLAAKSGPRKPSTTLRLEAALRYLTTDATRRHGARCLRPDGGRRLAVMEYRNHCDAASGWEPLTTVSAQGYHHAIVAAPEDWEPGAPLSIHDLTYRMITSREQARTQRFPDEYILCGTAADVRLQAGNAVPVNVARWIGERLADVLL
ncbi:C-5 cytosine-specific DNA methylase [Catenulispora acidiphila DSM 44928]|uniref:DNA (cytosine-5-)-methyltransferase n=1 Tax=Catenulispora acidiphila (strain DSM 44928 / JCM 14897 / NBRC 102108 / NRRL B-24433 / ID139908) TaxID=479433 RepID=C7QG78_CATAD|nr:DNA cytosine methyltransferase [Catenulispora acidiphila]ACU72923.1 C-5 cytosine-specific DNA methylase [Catenulispora acidiphila DSM 44928]